MTIEQLALIFDDSFMDVQSPSAQTVGRRSEIEVNSFVKWAADELYNYIANRIRSREDVSLETVSCMIDEFCGKCVRYKRLNKRSERAFSVAIDVANDIWEILYEMQ